MRIIKSFFLIFVLIFIVNSCDKEEIDKQKPEIDLDSQKAFPVNCDTLYFGETFTFKVLFKDNTELGSTKAFSIDIHNNFDHHSHSTEVSECTLAPVKKPINPFTLIRDYNIPEGLNEYETNVSVTIPSSSDNKIFDEGDYHFFISLTDKEGWSAQKGLSVKIIYRE